MYNTYNPYMQPRFQPIPQQYEQTQQPTTIINKPSLNGKIVDSIDVVKATDVPFDGSISYFPLADGSGIVTKQLQIDGTSKIMVYKPVENEKIETRYITHEDFDNEIKKLKDEINKLQEVKHESSTNV